MTSPSSIGQAFPCGARRRGLVLAALSLAALLGGCRREESLEQPRPLYGEEPVEYPLNLWDAGVEGRTVLRVRVTDTGAIDSIEVAESSGHPRLDSAAVSGVQDLQFEPGRRNGERIRMWATLPVVFSKHPQSIGSPVDPEDE